MANPLPTALDQLLVKAVATNGGAVPSRPWLNFTDGATVTDNPNFVDPTTGQVVGATVVAIPGGGGSGGQITNELTNGLNSNIPSNGNATLRFGGPTDAFSVGGIAPASGQSWQGGQRIVCVNTTTEPMTIINGDTNTTAGNRINTLTGLPVTVPPGRTGSVELMYDGTNSIFLLISVGLAQPLFTHAKDFVATGNGSTDDTAALLAGATVAAVAGGTYQIPAGTYYVASNLTFPSNVRVRFDPGAVLRPASSATITLTMVDATFVQQCFDVSLGGTISVLAEPILSVKWWGAQGAGSGNDDTAACQACIVAAEAIGAQVMFPPSTSSGYYTSGPLLVKTSNTTLFGMQASKATIFSRGNGVTNPYAGAYIGPSIVMAHTPAATPVTYSQSGNFWYAQMAATTGPSLYLSEYQQSSINQNSAFCFETWINIASAVANDTLLVSSGSATTHSTAHTAVLISVTESGGSYGLLFTLSTLGSALGHTGDAVNNSNSVTTSGDLTGSISAGNLIMFSSQAGIYYQVQSITSSAITLTTPYLGTTNAAASVYKPASHTVTTSGYPISANTNTKVACSYDGSYLRIYVGGVFEAHAAATGNIAQCWFEDFSIANQSENGQWPMGTPAWNTGDWQMASIRLSNTARYTSEAGGTPYPPETSELAVDSNTQLLFNFDPQYTPQNFAIAGCGVPLVTATTPCGIWYQWQYLLNIGPDAMGGVTLRDLNFNSWGDYIYGQCCTGVQIERCTGGSGQKGLTLVNNCYLPDIRNCNFTGSLHAAGVVGQSWAYGLINTSGLATMHSCMGYGAQFALVAQASGDISSERCYFIAHGLGSLYVNGGAFQGINCAPGDESGSTAYAQCVFNDCDNVWYDGGAIQVFTSTCPLVVVDGGTSLRFDTNWWGEYGCVAFYVPSAPLNPIAADGKNGNVVANPIPYYGSTNQPLLVSRLDSAGLNTLNCVSSGSAIGELVVTSNAGSMSTNDFMWGTIAITDTGTILTGTLTLTVPTVVAGYKRLFDNKTAQSVTVEGPTGSGVTIGSGKSAILRTDGTNWVRVTPDT